MEDFELSSAELPTDRDLRQVDEDFLKAIENHSSDACTTDSNEAFTFWFLIILLLLFIFFISLGVIMVAKGRRRRYEFIKVGYR